MIKNEKAPYCCNIVSLQIAVTTFLSLDCCKHRYQGGTCSYSNLDPNIEKRKQTECERARWLDIAVNTGIPYVLQTEMNELNATEIDVNINGILNLCNL